MSDERRSSHQYEITAKLRVSENDEERIREFLSKILRVKGNRLLSGLHLTVYQARRPLAGLHDTSQFVSLAVPTVETRFMTLVPGGENPRDGVDSRTAPIGIRVTRRNPAISEIQRLRANCFQFETREAIGVRKRTTAWTNCFGSRNYQPHIQLLKEYHKIAIPLGEVGDLFRSEIQEIRFDEFQVETRQRVNGEWTIIDNKDWRQASTPVLTQKEATLLRNDIIAAP